ncbi:MAG TPA: polysaccharide biosynthesis/export family protein [Chthoniobacterales bacterium]
MKTIFTSRICIFGILALFVVMENGCQTPTVFPQYLTTETPVSLSPGDTLKLSFSGSPELNQVQRIRSDGTITLPMIGEITARGKTLSNFQNELTGLYKSQLQNSEVIVTLESGGISVVVSGNVVNPGRLEFGKPTTALQALMQAGGANEFGDIRKVHLVRLHGGRQFTQIVDLSLTLDGQTTQALYLKDGDVIYVPQRFF